MDCDSQPEPSPQGRKGRGLSLNSGGLDSRLAIRIGRAELKLPRKTGPQDKHRADDDGGTFSKPDPAESLTARSQQGDDHV